MNRKIMIAAMGSGLPNLPAGWAYLVDTDGSYLVDSDGSYLIGVAS